MSQRIITWCFYILFFFTPLFFLKFTNELFEYNKMMLVYLLTIIITTTWVFKMVKDKVLLIKRTPLDIPLMLFLASQILSTIFSIDPHTSWWGYYSRSNGGLLSIISYILLYYALVSNFDKDKAISFLKWAVFGGVVVSLYAIPEHFGFSPSCLLLVGQFSADCWVQDVQARVFATLGQPNWLAAYLAMLIFPAIYFFLISKSTKSHITYLVSLITLYMAFTFTFSRGATLGLIAGGSVFLGAVMLNSFQHLTNKQSLRANALKIPTRNSTGVSPVRDDKSELKSRMTLLFIVISAFVIINLFYGSALTRFKLLNAQVAITPVQQIAIQKQEAGQLDVGGGTESGQIRLIVWQGAMDIFKHYPIFGSGVETFAYSYYNFRPLSHNMVSEWDFLYNKAHNEYLNYLATTGIFGFGSYMLIIIIFLGWSFLKIRNSGLNEQLLVVSLVAAYLSYLVQNIFGFSVVMIALLFYLFPAIAFLATDSISELKLSSNLTTFLNSTIYRRNYTKWLTLIAILLIASFFVIKLLVFWFADYLYKTGSDHSDGGNPVQGARLLSVATKLNPGEPLYHSELGFAASGYSVLALDQNEATIGGNLKDEAVNQINQAISISPKNTSIRRTAFQTYYQLALIYPEFEKKAIDEIDETIKLAPTDPKLYYNKGLVLSQFDKKKQAQEALQKAVELKPNYREARFNLAVVLFEMGKKDEAKKQMEIILQQIPNDPDVLNKLKEWEKAKTN